MHRFGAVGGDTVRRAGGLQGLPDVQAGVGRHVDFVAALARETDAHDARRDTGHGAGAPRHERKGGIVEVDIAAHRLQQRPAFRPGHGGGGPVVGDAGEVDLQLRPLGLQPAFEPGQHARRTAGGGVHQVMLGAQAHRDAVVEDHAVLVEHQAVAALADLELAPGVAVHPVQQRGRVRALDVDLAECRRVEHADRMAHGQHLAPHGGVQVFAALRIEPRALPLADVFEQGALLHMPGVDGGGADGLETIAQFQPGQGAESHRRVVGAKGRRADLPDGDPQCLRSDAHAVDVAGLALVGAETQRGVTLDVFDRLETLTHREQDVGGRHVVLQIDELLGCTRRAARVRHQPQRADAAAVPVTGDDGQSGFSLDGRSHPRRCPEAGGQRRCSAGPLATGDAVVQAVPPGAGTGRALGLHRRAWHERGLDVVPHRLAAGLAMQVDHRAQAA